MSMRYTFELPAVPDPTYVCVNPEREDIFERTFEDEDMDLPESFRAMYADMVEAKQSKTPIAYDYAPENYFHSSGAQAFIDQYAVYDDDGRLNMDMTSLKIGIPYNFNMLNAIAQGEIVGLSGSEDTSQPIEIHLDRIQQLHQATYGHEIGHYFFQVVKGFVRNGPNEYEEKFCDFFGRRMAMPLGQLDEYASAKQDFDGQSLLSVMRRFRVGLADALFGLMEYGILPPRVAIDTYNGKYTNEDYSKKVVRGIFCLHCMHVGGDYNCPGVSAPTPLFDLTDRAWGGKMQSCIGEDIYKPEILSTLTKFYVANEVQPVLFRPGALYEIPDED